MFYSRLRIYEYNEDDFRFQFLNFTKLSNNMDTHKHGNKREASLCLLINFYFEKNSSNLIEKSSLFY